jgi:hypothetical protein
MQKNPAMQSRGGIRGDIRRHLEKTGAGCFAWERTGFRRQMTIIRNPETSRPNIIGNASFGAN